MKTDDINLKEIKFEQFDTSTRDMVNFIDAMMISYTLDIGNEVLSGNHTLRVPIKEAIFLLIKSDIINNL